MERSSSAGAPWTKIEILSLVLERERKRYEEKPLRTLN